MAMRVAMLALLSLVVLQEPDIDALLNQLSDESIEARERSVTALIELGPKAETKVRAKMESSQGEARRHCERILARYSQQKRLDSVLPQLKRVTIESKDRKLKEVLQDLQRQSGLPMEFADLADNPVTVAVRDATPFEAINAVCKSAGLGYSIGGPPRAPGANPPPAPGEIAIRFKPGDYADAPRRFTGHFVLECTRINLTRRTRFDGPSLTGRLSLQLMWPPGVQPDQALLDIASVHDDKGKALYEKPNYAGFGQSSFGMMPGRTVFYSTSVEAEFRHPGEEVEKVSVRGTALILFAGEDRYITFEAPEKSLGQKREWADMSVELRNLKEAEGMTVVTIAFTGRPKNAVPGMRVAMGGLGSRLYKVRLEDGTTVDCGNTSGRGQGPVQVMDLNFPGLTSKIVAVDVLAETAYHEERFEFEFKDILLPK
jgi:hypothetical protein